MRNLMLALIMSACGAVVPDGLARLNALSPIEADPAHLEVALILPQGLSITPGGARVDLSARRASSGNILTGQFALTQTQGDPADFGVSTGETALFLKIAASDVERLRALQSQIANWKTLAPDDTTGSLSVSLAGCATGAGPAPDARASIYLRTEQRAAFFALIRNADLKTVLQDTQGAHLGPCQ